MYEVFGFYRFLNIKYLKKNKRLINEVLIKNNIRGTIIISKEGINGSISGKEPDIKTTINKAWTYRLCFNCFFIVSIFS